VQGVEGLLDLTADVLEVDERLDALEIVRAHFDALHAEAPPGRVLDPQPPPIASQLPVGDHEQPGGRRAFAPVAEAVPGGVGLCHGLRRQVDGDLRVEGSADEVGEEVSKATPMLTVTARGASRVRRTK